MDFYLELSSDSKFYPGNAADSFRTLIEPTIPLKGAWEVALTEISLPRYKHTTTETIQTIIGEKKSVTAVKLGVFDEAEQFVASIRVTGLTLRYINGKVYYTIQSGMKVKFSPLLANILGLKADHEYTGRGYSDEKVDLEHGLKPILFQSSLITPQVFRESRRPILRSLYHQGHVELTPKYCRVVDRDLEELSFYITSANNRRVHFVPGSVDFTLHFRPCSRG